MATTCLTNNFRKGLLNGNFNLSSDTIKMALYNGSSHNQNTTAYTTVNQVPNGSGYTTGGVTMVGPQQLTDTTFHVSHYDWTTDPSWASSTITAADCLIWDDTATAPVPDPSIYVGDFGSSTFSSSGTFTVVLPPQGYNTSVVRLA